MVNALGGYPSQNLLRLCGHCQRNWLTGQRVAFFICPKCWPKHWASMHAPQGPKSFCYCKENPK